MVPPFSAFMLFSYGYVNSMPYGKMNTGGGKRHIAWKLSIGRRITASQKNIADRHIAPIVIDNVVSRAVSKA